MHLAESLDLPDGLVARPWRDNVALAAAAALEQALGGWRREGLAL